MNGRTIVPGTFDGVHLGHLSLIEKAREIKEDTRLTVLTFAPHPQLFLGKARGNFLLSTQEEKEELLRLAGVEEVITLPFEDALRDITPREFFEEILLGKLGMRKIVVGEDFRFGKDRKGNVDMLSRLGALHKVEVFIFPPFKVKGRIVKSETIRRFLKKGEVKRASELLGRLYSVKGKVVKGQGIGHELGYPTANLEVPPHKLLPREGVYAVKVKMEGSLLNGICYIGNRPTISSDGETSCEVHLFEVEGNFLGKTLEVLFVQDIRGERRFSSLQELSQQIARDIIKAKQLLSIAAGK